MNLHFICPKGRNRRELGNGRFESGYWNVADLRADAAVNGRIYLHERQNEPSWQGGTIDSWHAYANGKKIFVYQEDGDQHVICLEGWGQEQATVRDGGDTPQRMFWLTYKPLSPGFIRGWPREKLSELVRSFKTDPNGTTEWWRLNSYKQAQIGDGVFVFKQGEEPRGIFGRGVIIDGPRPRADTAGDDGEKWRVKVRFTELVDPEHELLLPLDGLREALTLETNDLVNRRASGYRVPPAIAAEISAQLDALARSHHVLAADEADDGRPDVFDTTDQRERTLRAICVRRGQSAFRTALMQAYDRRCAITGCAVADVLEAAHIVAYNGPATNEVTNGLLLRTDLHTLFDCGLIAIDPKSRTVIIAERLVQSSYGKLMGQRLRNAVPITQGPSRKTLERRFADFNSTSGAEPRPVAT